MRNTPPRWPWFALVLCLMGVVAVAGDRYIGVITLTSASLSNLGTAAPFTAPRWGSIQCDDDFRFRTSADAGLATANDAYVGPKYGETTRLWDFKLAPEEAYIAALGADGGARSCKVYKSEF